jgi:hypothetical protein
LEASVEALGTAPKNLKKSFQINNLKALTLPYTTPIFRVTHQGRFPVPFEA